MNKRLITKLALCAALVGLVASSPMLAIEPGTGFTERRIAPFRAVEREADTIHGGSPLYGVIVSDLSPQAVVGQDRIRIRQSQWVGPFAALETQSLYVYALFARHLVEGGAFDLQAEFLLPDGSSYQKRILPVSAEGGDKAMVMRRDLSPRLTKLSAPQQLGILKRIMPSEDVARLTPAWTDYVAVPLPVSGTWITKHNLYGEWTVLVTLKRGRTVLAEQSQTFELMR